MVVSDYSGVMWPGLLMRGIPVLDSPAALQQGALVPQQLPLMCLRMPQRVAGQIVEGYLPV